MNRLEDLYHDTFSDEEIEQECINYENQEEE